MAAVTLVMEARFASGRSRAGGWWRAAQIGGRGELLFLVERPHRREPRRLPRVRR